MKLLSNIKQYVEHYNDSDLKKVLTVMSKKIGTQIVLYALILYTLIRDTDIPIKVRMMFMAALGYLILPTDLVCDLLPIIGFTDDIAFLTYVISSAGEYITPEVREKAESLMGNWINNEAEDVEIVEDDNV